MVTALSGGNINQYAYGSVERSGTLPNGRIVYDVTDSEGNKAGKFSIPKEQTDTFEASYKTIMETAPKIKKYVDENSSDEDLRRRRSLGRNIVATCGAIGAAVPILLLWKAGSMAKKILGTVAGVVIGLAAGFGISLSATTPPGSKQFARASRTISNLDIEPVLDEKV